MARLTELEEIVVMLADVHRPEAYPLRLARALRAEHGRTVTISTMHAVLNKLERRGLLISVLKDATEERGDRRKRIYAMTLKGREALDACWKMHGITTGGAEASTAGDRRP